MKREPSNRRECPWAVCVCVRTLSLVYLFATPWTVCSLPGTSVRGIFQARTMEQVAISYSRGIFQIQESNLRLLCLLHWQVDSLALRYLGSPIYTLGGTQFPCIAGGFFYQVSHKGSLI